MLTISNDFSSKNVLYSLPMKPGSDNVVNDRYMPTLASGLIGVSVYSENLFVNGLYNGKGPNSHRAKVPALIMARVRLASNVNFVNRKFSFNALTGINSKAHCLHTPECCIVLLNKDGNIC